jgi:hypothetical protein
LHNYQNEKEKLQQELCNRKEVKNLIQLILHEIKMQGTFYIKSHYDLGNFLKSLSYLGLTPELKDILKVCKKLRIKGQPGQLSNLAFCLN